MKILAALFAVLMLYALPALGETGPHFVAAFLNGDQVFLRPGKCDVPGAKAAIIAATEPGVEMHGAEIVLADKTSVPGCWTGVEINGMHYIFVADYAGYLKPIPMQAFKRLTGA